MVLNRTITVQECQGTTSSSLKENVQPTQRSPPPQARTKFATINEIADEFEDDDSDDEFIPETTGPYQKGDNQVTKNIGGLTRSGHRNAAKKSRKRVSSTVSDPIYGSRVLADVFQSSSARDLKSQELKTASEKPKVGTVLWPNLRRTERNGDHSTHARCAG
jgi:hypothetical protein